METLSNKISRMLFTFILNNLWFIPLLLLIGLFISIVIEFSNGYQFHPRHLLLFSPLAVYPLCLAFGILFESRSGSQNLRTNLGVAGIQAILLFQIFLSIWLVYSMDEYRLISAFIVTIELVFGYFCCVIAGMLITETYL